MRVLVKLILTIIVMNCGWISCRFESEDGFADDMDGLAATATV